ncbi:hypothetical protein L484_013779 [Morus notabilis]|uniref:Uncharacterized protein n=1 Tax=Morus notabilis TaxID=981085 RepID=W9QHT8_9ROSA|nr:hypothetical protein L484_013779 [Morus notabilis]
MEETADRRDEQYLKLAELRRFIEGEINPPEGDEKEEGITESEKGKCKTLGAECGGRTIAWGFELLSLSLSLSLDL